MSGKIFKTVPLLFFFIISCDSNVYNIEISGKIFDKESKKPIKNAIIYYKTWIYSIRLDESHSKIDSVITDVSGYYLLKIKKAESVDLAIISQGHLKEIKYLKLFNSKQHINFSLNKKSSE